MTNIYMVKVLDSYCDTFTGKYFFSTLKGAEEFRENLRKQAEADEEEYGFNKENMKISSAVEMDIPSQTKSVFEVYLETDWMCESYGFYTSKLVAKMAARKFHRYLKKKNEDDTIIVEEHHVMSSSDDVL